MGLGSIGHEKRAKQFPRRATRCTVNYPATMALKSTIFKAELQVSDLDRNHFATHSLTLARHPSETDERMMVRLLAFALNADELRHYLPDTVAMLAGGERMTAEMFARSAGIELTRIPYKGNGQAIGDLIGGHLSMMVLSLSPILGNVKDGKLFALAVTTPDRSKLLPDVPTIAESALPGFSAAIRYGLAAPAGTSAAIVDRLARELRAAVMSEDVQERMLSEGAQPMASTPAEYAAEIDSEERKWSALVKSLNLKME